LVVFGFLSCCICYSDAQIPLGGFGFLQVTFSPLWINSFALLHSLVFVPRVFICLFCIYRFCTMHGTDLLLYFTWAALYTWSSLHTEMYHSGGGGHGSLRNRNNSVTM
jgi:hypothetical protein